MSPPTGPDSALMFTVRDGEPLRLTKEQVCAGSAEACLSEQLSDVDDGAHPDTVPIQRQSVITAVCGGVRVAPDHTASDRCCSCHVMARR